MIKKEYKKSSKKFKVILKKKKKNSRQCGRETYKNLLENEKQKLVQ